MSTSADQVAIAPGYLTKSWKRGNRRFFRYEMDRPILHFYTFLSAKYVTVRDHWKSVAIEVLHHPGHAYNVRRMIDAVKKSLAYFTREFGPYQHQQVRIVEFPRYRSFAQSFPNTIPYSESIGFIARIDDNDIDYPFWVTAHEVAHQWWAHQVIGGNVQGATALSESLAQYSSLMVMEKEYGSEKIHRFLRYELDSYLGGRTRERKKELPLMLVENQPYIHYNKGSLVMYRVRDLIGEEALNDALAKYIAQVKYQAPPYTTTRELLGFIRDATPDEYRYALTDLFEKITLFDNRTLKANCRQRADGRYEVVLHVLARKMRADDNGAETQIKIGDHIDIGIFGKDEKPLYLQKHFVKENTFNIKLVVDEKPLRAGIDPYNKLIDRHPDDNTAAVVIQ